MKQELGVSDSQIEVGATCVRPRGHPIRVGEVAVAET